GTSGNVYPAAQFVQQATRAGAQTLELNLEATPGTTDFDQSVRGKAGDIVPAWVDETLAA
ncbi:MAG: NAD-dependent protein deacylase, partial [Pseudomonadota bacterium]